MKKFLISILVVLNLISFTVSAQANEPSITALKDFFLYSENKQKVCEILESDEKALDNYCEKNNILQFAVNEDNTKQIKLLSYENEFSKATVDFDFFSKKELEENMGNIVGHKEKRPLHSVVTVGEQSFIKTDYSDMDINGAFSFTQYYTVQNSKIYCLVFLTNEGNDTSHIKGVFDDFAKNEIFSKENSGTKSEDRNTTIIIVAIVAVSVLALAILITVIKDIMKPKKSHKEEIEQEE